jgi:hypothetical protein
MWLKHRSAGYDYSERGHKAEILAEDIGTVYTTYCCITASDANGCSC